MSVNDNVNVLGAMLGNGWWSCGNPPGTTQPNCRRDDPPQVKLQLQVDGRVILTSHAMSLMSTKILINGETNQQWTATQSPILYNSLYQGEIYDGRLAERTQKWLMMMENEEDEDDDDDEKITGIVYEAHSVANQAKLRSQLFEPIQHIASLPPVSISVTGTDASTNTLIQVVDFGQNMAGVVRLKQLYCQILFKKRIHDKKKNVQIIKHPNILLTIINTFS